MGLSNLAEKAPKRKDPAVATITIGGDDDLEIQTLEFRRPKVADMQPTMEQIQALLKSTAGMTPVLAYQSHLLGECYIPAPGEGQVAPGKMFAKIAATNDLLFADIMTGFEREFPEFTNWFTAKSKAKNDSWRAEHLDTESPTPLSGLDANPAISET